MKLEELTALYTPLDIEYSQVMSGPYEDLSYHGKDCKVIAGLKDGRISGFWRPVVAVGDDKDLKLHIERLYEICPNIYYMDFLIDGKLSVISQFLLRHGHKARPYYTQIIDLTKTEEELHADLRKSYKQLVKKEDKWLSILSSQSIRTMRKIREKAGREDRCEESWEIQEKIIQGGKAYLSGGEHCMVMFYHNNLSSYYFSSISLPNITTHHIMWKAILEAKSYGCKMLEMGEQIFNGDKKLCNISLYKRGFGGRTVTRLIIEKEIK